MITDNCRSEKKEKKKILKTTVKSRKLGETSNKAREKLTAFILSLSLIVTLQIVFCCQL